MFTGASSRPWRRRVSSQNRLLFAGATAACEASEAARLREASE
jgi:hypothetical protein